MSASANQVLWRGKEQPTPEVLDELAQQARSGVSHEKVYAQGLTADASIVERSRILEIKERTLGVFYPTSNYIEIVPVPELTTVSHQAHTAK